MTEVIMDWEPADLCDPGNAGKTYIAGKYVCAVSEKDGDPGIKVTAYMKLNPDDEKFKAMLNETGTCIREILDEELVEAVTDLHAARQQLGKTEDIDLFDIMLMYTLGKEGQVSLTGGHVMRTDADRYRPTMRESAIKCATIAQQGYVEWIRESGIFAN